MPFGGKVQPYPQCHQKMQAFLQMVGLGFGDDAVFGEFPPTFAPAGGFGAPQKHLQIPKAPRAFLEVGLQGVGAVVVVLVALLHLQEFSTVKKSRVQIFAEVGVDRFKERLVAREVPRFQKGRGNRNIVLSCREHFRRGSHHTPDRKVQIPEFGDKPFDACVRRRGVIFRQQYEYVDVGKGKHFAPTVTADRDDGAR